MDIHVYRSFASWTGIFSLFPTAGDEQGMYRINAATRIAKLRRRTDIREYPTVAAFVSIVLPAGHSHLSSRWARFDTTTVTPASGTAPLHEPY
jgi:hypothetical protein